MIYPTWRITPNSRFVDPRPQTWKRRLGIWIWNKLLQLRLIDHGIVFVTIYGTRDNIKQVGIAITSAAERGIEPMIRTEDLEFSLRFAGDEKEAFAAMKTDQRLT